MQSLLIFLGESFVSHVESNGACQFLAIDGAGLIISCYLWYILTESNNFGKLMLTLPVALALGPTAHFSILCIDREVSLNKVDQDRRKLKKE